MARAGRVFDEENRVEEEGEGIRVGSAGDLSYHRSKCLWIKMKMKQWRTQRGRTERAPRVKWKVLRDPVRKEEYRRGMREMADEGNFRRRRGLTYIE